ncbi:MAG: DNA polymerase I [Tenericutes bacterium HGW-Tenericutes-1]|jgi:DNA polymerase-1|nr:MAG: DNA polymerase I [Tenericutes bacterium HGW-Tenericutes-1]
MKKLLLVDGNNLLFRSYYATAAMGNLMKNSQGVYTNAVFGFVSAMQGIVKMDYTHILVAWDPKGPTWRHLKYETYKGTRKETPSELISQMPLVRDYLDSANIARYEQDLYEADDIIGYCATHFSSYFDQIDIFSNDHDLFQLLGPNVRQVISKKGISEIEIYTPDVMVEKLGIRPDQMRDYKGLVGDVSDNIPGIPGVGDKTATKLLETYGTLESLLENTTDLKGKLKEKVETYREQALFSKELATIVTNFENTLAIDDFEYKGPNLQHLKDFLQKMELHSLIRKIDFTSQVKNENLVYTTITEALKLNQILLSGSALHLELFGTNYHVSEKIGFAISNQLGSFYLDYKFALSIPSFINWLKDASSEKYVYDFKQTKVALMWDLIDIQGVTFDLLLAAYLINPNMTKEDMRVVTANFEYNDVEYDEIIYGRGAKYKVPDDIEVVKKHVTDKARAIFILKDKVTKISLEYDQLSLLNDIEIPLAKTLAKMEYEGIKIDTFELERFGDNLFERIANLEKEIYILSGEEFNINSPKQLGVILFEKLNLPYYKKSKSGYTTDISVLEQLVDYNPIISKIIEYRSLTKLYSTYYEGIKTALAVKNDSRVHTIYKQTIAQTGRLSSIEPNLQNIPIKTDDGKELRKIFIADIASQLYSCDYSQIELRVLAHMAQVKNLMSAFQSGEDVHTHTAKLIFHKDEITSNERRQAKAVNFGIIYGKTSWGLSEDLKISPKQAELFIQHYFENFPEIKGFMDRQIENAKTNGYVKTILNRRRYIPEVRADNYQVREFGKRMAMNAPIQGSAADLLKKAMVLIDKAFEDRNLKSKILLQIHDELVINVTIDETAEVEKLVLDYMENAIDFSVPLTVEGSFGANLFEVK